MPKTLTLVRAGDGLPRAEFMRDFLAWGREQAARFDALTVNLVDVPAAEAGLRPGGTPSFDAVLETWGSAQEPAVEWPRPSVGAAFSYAVEETVEKPATRNWHVGERSPGVKSFFLALRHPSMTHDEMAAYWGEKHAPLALRVHVGMWRYTRNVVTAALTPGAPDWDGMAILQFRTSKDLREHFYDSDAGRAAIAEDVAKFSGGGRALHTSEYVLKSESESESE